MRGKSASLLLLGLALCGAIAVHAFTIGPGGQWQLVNPLPTAAPRQSATVPATGDLLEFIDGSFMHGDLKQMDVTTGLRWANPAAAKPIDLQPAHIDSIRFAHSNPVTVAPRSHLRFANGDDLFGSVTSMDDNHLSFSTWFGQALLIPKTAVQSITILSSNYSIIYEGPGDADGWVIGSHNPESWVYSDGAFVSSAPGSLGRDFGLSYSSTIEFDLSWNDIFQLLINIYSDAVDHLDVGNSYMLELTRDQVNMRHVDANRQFPLRAFGSAVLPNHADRNKIHVTIQANKQEGTVSFYVDGVLAKRWKDENGFTATGGGILFQQQSMTGATLTLRNFKVSEWSGRFEPETSASVTNVDAIRLINHDEANGKITGISEGKVTLAMGETVLQIPIQRITQINFAAATFAAGTQDPWQVRAHFPRGGNLSFQLEKWNDKEISGKSAIFGALAFQPGQISQLEFNLGHPRVSPQGAPGREFEDLDE